MHPYLGRRDLTWGRRVPASALSSWGSMPQLGNTMIREGTRFVFACQGIEPCQANADAGTRRPQVRLRPPLDEIAPPQVRLCRPQVRLRPPQGSSLYDVIQHTFILNLCTCFLHLLYNVYICDLKSFFKINLRTLWNFTILFS